METLLLGVAIAAIIRLSFGYICAAKCKNAESLDWLFAYKKDKRRDNPHSVSKAE